MHDHAHTERRAIEAGVEAGGRFSCFDGSVIYNIINEEKACGSFPVIANQS